MIVFVQAGYAMWNCLSGCSFTRIRITFFLLFSFLVPAWRFLTLTRREKKGYLFLFLNMIVFEQPGYAVWDFAYRVTVSFSSKSYFCFFSFFFLVLAWRSSSTSNRRNKRPFLFLNMIDFVQLGDKIAHGVALSFRPEKNLVSLSESE